MSLLEEKPLAAPEARQPPPDPGSPPPPPTRACKGCGAALEPDQLACVECGHVVRRRRLVPSGWPRRAGLAACVALVVSACAGLGANAAVQGGGKLPKTVAVAPPATPPPSTSAPATPTSPGPAAAPAAPAKPAAPATPAKPTSPAGAGTPANGGGPGGHNASPGGNGSPGNSTPAPAAKEAQPSGGGATAFPNGIPFSGDGPVSDSTDNSGLNNAWDQDPKTVWHKTTSSPGGIWLDAGSFGAYAKFGLYASGSYTVHIYGSNYNTAPTDGPGAGSGWTDLSQQDRTVQAGKNFIRLTYPSGFQARFYLVWITSGPAGVADTALLTG